MEKECDFDVTQDFFSAKKVEDIAVLSFEENLLLRAIDLQAKTSLFACLERISKNDAIKVLLIMGSPEKTGREEYIAFYRQVFESKLDHYAINRMYNAVDQFILQIVDFNKMVVHADSGKVISLFMNTSLACDYRIVADNTVFENPYLELDLVPKGGGAFFLSKRLGTSKAFEILLSGEDITAQEALRLGIVDKVVPLAELNKEALKIARGFAEKPTQLLSGVKKLLNYSMKDIEEYLKLENQVLLGMLGQVAL
ncbi:MAG: enoyl-CoA hydratase/isomerase family protein [Deltaproteobacteria bacterium]|nr:enoyl-CoA hydratase/isomerase family protein [Deltaproteobacteria bacterium]